MSSKPKIALTLGDPNGIGPEIVAKTAASEEITEICEPVVFASAEIVSQACKLAGVRSGGFEVVDCGNFLSADLCPGGADEKSGRAAISYIEEAAGAVLSGNVSAIVTAPVSKKALKLAGSPYPGHTEMLCDLTGSEGVVMMFESGALRVALVTVHCSLAEVPSLITQERVFSAIQICAAELADRFGIKSPSIAVCGLNPHAGEEGEFGDEEMSEIAPAVMRASAGGVNVVGPLPADSVFYQAVGGKWDAVISMYHDQGLAPFKMLSFHTGVNITLGLPIVRTSPDHGTAFDIAWSGVADSRSIMQAVKTAVRLAGNLR